MADRAGGLKWGFYGVLVFSGPIIVYGSTATLLAALVLLRLWITRHRVRLSSDRRSECRRPEYHWSPFGGQQLETDCTRGLTGFDVGTRRPRSATGVAQLLKRGTQRDAEDDALVLAA